MSSAVLRDHCLVHPSSEKKIPPAAGGKNIETHTRHYTESERGLGTLNFQHHCQIPPPELRNPH